MLARVCMVIMVETRETGEEAEMPPHPLSMSRVIRRGEPGSGAGCRLGLRAAASFDLDHLATAIGAARRADVMRPARGATVRAGHELRGDQKMMAAAVALPRTADALLGKCTHDDLSLPWAHRMVRLPGIVLSDACDER